MITGIFSLGAAKAPPTKIVLTNMMATNSKDDNGFFKFFSPECAMLPIQRKQFINLCITSFYS